MPRRGLLTPFCNCDRQFSTSSAWTQRGSFPTDQRQRSTSTLRLVRTSPRADGNHGDDMRLVVAEEADPPVADTKPEFSAPTAEALHVTGRKRCYGMDDTVPIRAAQAAKSLLGCRPNDDPPRRRVSGQRSARI